MGTITKRYDGDVVVLPWMALPTLARERCLAPISEQRQGTNVSTVDSAARLLVSLSADFGGVVGRVVGEPSVHSMKPKTTLANAQETVHGIQPRRGLMPPD